MEKTSMERVVCLFYLYEPVASLSALAASQTALGTALGLKGRVRVAKEGINGTVCGSAAAIAAYCAELTAAFVAPIDFKLGPDHGGDGAFAALRVREVEQICTLGAEVDLALRGEHLAPEQWHRMLSGDDGTSPSASSLVVLDVRNRYESDIGRFRGAIRPDIRKFSDLTTWLDTNAASLQGKHVAMYCTGGIRCETASAFINSSCAPARVYQLAGGIHRYLESFDDGGHFEGKNFVFDQRGSVAATAASSSSSSGGASSIVGRCTVCAAPHDSYRYAEEGGRRCRICRQLVLICDACVAVASTLIFCDSHTAWRDDVAAGASGSGLAKRRRELQGTLAATRGRKLKRQRQRVKKQIALVDAVAKEAKLLGRFRKDEPGENVSCGGGAEAAEAVGR